MKKITVLSFLIIIALTSFSQEVYRWYQDGKVVFQLKQNTPQPKSIGKKVNIAQFPFIQSLDASFQIQNVIQLHPGIEDKKLVRTYELNFDAIQKVDQVVRAIDQSEKVLYAEKKELHEKSLTPNDPDFVNSVNNGQWGLFKINAQQAWNVSTGASSIVVAVADNAIHTGHPDLTNKLIPGRDVADNDNDPTPCGSNSGFHGTHVSGIAGAETNNSTGIASISYNTSIMPIKIGDCSGALTSGYDGITWAADNGADVVNMSWGSAGSSTYGQNVCDYAWNQGTILIAAAGNDDNAQQFYPAGYNNVVSVASTDDSDSKSGFSNYGNWIDISAPGSSILSLNENNGYQTTQGTSMASPLVAGLVGLMKSHAPSATNQDIVTCLLNTADNIDGSNPSYIGELGSGRINAYQALQCMNQYTYSTDIGISEIISPKGSLCSGSTTPEIVLKNYGSNTITSATINYDVGGSPSQVYNWTGSIAQSDTVHILLSSLSPGSGSFTFNATSSSPNGNADQNASNDSRSSNFTLSPNGQITNFTLTTDCYGSEVEWEIESDATGNIVYSGGPYTNTAGGSTYNEDICLSSGCYTFTIMDDYGDGMYGSQWNCSVNGDYSLENSSGNVLFQMTATNADFGSQTSHSFCVSSNVALDAGISSINAPASSSCNTSITPVVVLTNFGTQTLTSADINYQVSGGAQQTMSWTGSLTSGNSTVVTLPSVSVTAGTYTFDASTSNPNGSTDLNTSNDADQSAFTVFNSAQAPPFSEDFESNSFATNQWSINNADNGITWEIVTAAGSTPGNKVAKLDFFNYGNGSERDGMQSPPLDFSNHNNIEMDFDHAFRRYNTNSADSLIIYASTDCGTTFDRVVAYAEDGSGSFATATTSTTEFDPASGEWCTGTVGANCFTVNLNAYSGQSSVIIKFESFNDGISGNNLFLDNINIDGDQVGTAPTADFGANTTEICIGETVNFNDNSTGTPNSWDWDFGDGNTSTNQNPNHTYAATGTYTVELTASNSNGSDTEVSGNLIVVHDTSSGIQNVTICDGETIDVGNSTYTTQGTYTNVLTNANGCDSTVTTNLTVNPLPNISLSAAESILCEGDGAVQVTTSPAGGTLSGPGISSTMFDPNTAGAGSHTITYSYTNADGCQDQSTIGITVNECLGVEENEDDLIHIFPNPNKGSFVLQGIEAGSRYFIYTTDGRLMQKGIVRSVQEQIQLKHVTPGHYMMGINNDRERKVMQFIIEK